MLKRIITSQRIVSGKILGDISYEKEISYKKTKAQIELRLFSKNKLIGKETQTFSIQKAHKIFLEPTIS